jgi:hypothetical protein
VLFLIAIRRRWFRHDAAFFGTLTATSLCRHALRRHYCADAAATFHDSHAAARQRHYFITPAPDMLCWLFRHFRHYAYAADVIFSSAAMPDTPPSPLIFIVYFRRHFRHFTPISFHADAIYYAIADADAFSPFHYAPPIRHAWPRRRRGFPPPFSLSSAFAAIISRYFTPDTPILSFHYFAMLLMLPPFRCCQLFFMPLFLLMLIYGFSAARHCHYAIDAISLSFIARFFAAIALRFSLIFSLFSLFERHFAMPLILRHYATPLAIDAAFILLRHAITIFHATLMSFSSRHYFRHYYFQYALFRYAYAITPLPRDGHAAIMPREDAIAQRTHAR